MNQKNRVQLSFSSILKIFAIYGLSSSIPIAIFYFCSMLFSHSESNMAFVDLFLSVLLAPFIFLIFAVLGYPAFYYVNKFRGGLELTVLKSSIKKDN